ncbi:T9SS type A sorting domain-containing protein [Hymenobacter aquaticus]|uniref:T9SS type A sorting domain-containing protein n=1 Tax=Hymenobacter aquaticus TaxID=1867101 RepID=A0A4Z0Q288_9BACT|nr:T9SS type A sorting domain-containing protein [Hymenobacter aquaticus]TGE23724.1 T9SS type A sorting domain-containing protein [Hymenobacter aquaticus]
MQKLLLAASLLISTAASAQVTLENTYVLNAPAMQSEDLFPIKLSTGEAKYVRFNSATRLMTLYNLNHSQFKQLTVPAPPAGYGAPGIDYVSDKLFNQDAALEYIVYYNRTNATSQETTMLNVYSEAGTLLLRSDSAYVNHIFNTSAGTKMLLSKAYPSLTGGNRSKVVAYALGGTLTTLKTQQAEADGLRQPYPNPATESLRLPYEVKKGTATLRITDAAGRTVATYQVDSTFDHLLLNAGELRSGVYFYQVVAADGSASPARRFVVSH